MILPRDVATMCVSLIIYFLAISAFLEVESRDFIFTENRSEKELLLELQDVLEKLQSKRISTWESKLNQVPKCIIGDSCAVKRGARIGKLCDCPRSTSCHYRFLKCL